MPLRRARPKKRPRASTIAMRRPKGRLPTMAQKETRRLSRTADSSSGLSRSQSMSGEHGEALLLQERLGLGGLDVVEEESRVRVGRGGEERDLVDDRRV